jgi:hypothetical protein
VSAGVRNLDGRPDGRRGSVRQNPRQDRSRSAGRPGGHADRTPTMLTSLGRGPWPAVAVVPGVCPAARRVRCRVRGGYRRDRYVSVLVASGRSAAGHPSKASDRRGSVATRPARPHVPDTNRPDGSSSGSRGRTVSPLLALTRYNFLYPSARPALRAASGRPPARQQHDTDRGAGSPSQPQGGDRNVERGADAPLGSHGCAPTGRRHPADHPRDYVVSQPLL